MAYEKTAWVDGGAPAINAANLNKMETGIDEAHDHLIRTDNPHGVTKVQIGLSNVDNIQQATKAEFNSHVGSGGAAHAAAVANGASGFMTGADKAKLDTVAQNANNYVHPSSHPATMIQEDANHRFVNDSQITYWNNKVDQQSSGLKTMQGALAIAGQPWYEAARTTDQSIPSKSWTRVVPNSIIGNIGAGTQSGGIYTVPYAGRYSLQMYANLSGVVAGSINYIAVLINGGLADSYRMAQKTNESIYDGQLNGSVLLYLQPGDQVQFCVYNGDSVARMLTSSYQRCTFLA